MQSSRLPRRSRLLVILLTLAAYTALLLMASSLNHFEGSEAYFWEATPDSPGLYIDTSLSPPDLAQISDFVVRINGFSLVGTPPDNIHTVDELCVADLRMYNTI